MMELASKAIIFAVKAHDGMRRKRSDVPYVLHPMEAAAIVGSMTSNQEVIAAAALHDVVEDAEIPLEQIKTQFGPRVAELVGSETEDKRKELPPEDSWKIRKEEAIQLLKNTQDLEVKILYLGDKLANMRSIYQEWKKDGDAIWNCFHQSDPAEHAWYYRAIADQTKELSDTLAWQEYYALIQTVFGEEE